MRSELFEPITLSVEVEELPEREPPVNSERHSDVERGRSGELPKLVSRAEAAAYCGVSASTCDRWRQRHRIESIGPAGSPPRFRRSDVIRIRVDLEASP